MVNEMGKFFTEDRDLKKRIIILASKLIIENGGETYRSEETIDHLCRAFGATGSHVVAIPTGIFLTIDDGDCHETLTIRIKSRSVDLGNLDQINATTRNLCEGTLTLKQGEEILRNIHNGTTPRRTLLMAIAAGLSAACFTLLFDGTWLDCIISVLCGFFCQLITGFVKKTDFVIFLKGLLGGLLTSGLAAILVLLFGGNLEKIIIGAIMPLLPGLAITNSVRDLMRGDLVSGGARLTESFVIAVAIAAGVGISLSVYLKFGGVLV